MFLRLQWLETVGRYEAIFRDRPPTLIAFFAERVNLCKGHWNPNGGTATAYIWLVWVREVAPLPPYWIPPGQRESLTREGDRERFTAQPVLRIAMSTRASSPADAGAAAWPDHDGFAIPKLPVASGGTPS
jgi:hypothetical protein